MTDPKVVGLQTEVARLREFVESVAYQWGSWRDKDGRRHLGNMGLSVLEEAFDILGWSDPQPCDQKTGQAPRGTKR